MPIFEITAAVPKPTISSSIPAVTKSSTLTQAQLLPSKSSVAVTTPSEFPTPISAITLPTETRPSVIETATCTSNSLPSTITSSKKEKKPRTALRDPRRLWENCTIPYEISERYTEEQKGLIQDGMNEFERRKTSIIFTPRTSETTYMHIEPENRYVTSIVVKYGTGVSQSL
ncbi:hypothetical protein TNCV_192601 [Trichonephila clavipes]|nr:hypothetical protein TNCV_192601 [Trichonephila clavipes]